MSSLSIYLANLNLKELLIFYVSAQEVDTTKLDTDIVDTLPVKNWKLKSLYSLNGTQSSFVNWNSGGRNNIGPKLWNVMFRPVGSVADYKYSKALSSYGKEWSWEEMNGFLLKPAKWIKGNKMGFAGLKKDEDRASVILYLNKKSDNPKQLP